jgi:hypothetical protein
MNNEIILLYLNIPEIHYETNFATFILGKMHFGLIGIDIKCGSSIYTLSMTSVQPTMQSIC